MASFSVPTTLQEVIDELGAVADWAARDGNRLGYFAVLYRTVTQSVQKGIADGFFDNGDRMADFDVAFAAHYFRALAAHRAGDAPRRSWQVAFGACERRRPIVLQHLLLGMNAHINLDLGIATAETAPGDQLPTLRRDFDRINEVLASVMEDVQRQLHAVSPLLGLLDLLGGRHDDAVVRFSIESARAEAWGFAGELAPLDRDAWSGPIRSRDRRVARLGRAVARPGWLRLGLLPIRLLESGDVPAVIDVLRRATPLDFDALEMRVRDREDRGRADGGG